MNFDKERAKGIFSQEINAAFELGSKLFGERMTVEAAIAIAVELRRTEERAQDLQRTPRT